MVLQVMLGEQLGHGTIPAGLPGGAGGPAGPPAPNVGAGWEVKVLAAPDFKTLLAVIPSKMLLTLQFAKQLKDLGSGTVTLDMDDSFWSSVTLPNSQPAHYLLDYEHVWQVWQDGVCRFEFLGETVTETLVDQSEQRVATVTGPGTAATLKWAMAAPPGFPGNIRYKLDAITDGFSETDVNGNLVLDTGLWNAATPTSHLSLNPSGSCRLMGSPGTTYLGTTAYDATNTLVSAQMSPIVSPDAAGNSLNGSQVTQMYVQSLANSNYYALFGLSATTFYVQLRGPSGTFTKTIASATAFGTAMAGNQDYQYWQISESGGQGGGSGTFFFWTSPDGQNWTQQWSIVHNWDATNCGLYFAATYSTDNAEFATVTGINSNVTTSSLNGPSYYAKPIIGGVWLDLLNQAKARGTVPFMTTGQLSSSTDSFGNPWSDSQSVQIANGTDLYTLLGAHASMINADWVMQPGFRLQVGIPETGKITLGTDRSSTVIFRDGMDCTARVRTRARDQVSNLLAVINSDGRTITATDSASVTAYGQREAWLQAAMQVTEADLVAVATAADLQNGSEVLSWTLQVAPYIPGRTIFTGFDVGDWVGLERPDFSAVDDVRVVAIAVQVNADGSETHELTLNSYIQWLQEQLAYIQTKLGGGFINAAGTTAIASSITSQNSPSVFSLTLGSLGDVTSGGPGGNAPLVYDPVTGQWVPAGSNNTITGNVPVVVSGTGGTVTVAGTGGSVVVAAPAPPPADGGAPVTPPANTTLGIFTTTITDATGTVRQIIGAQSDGTVTTKDVNGGAPGSPDTPTVTGTLNGILVSWDGLLAGASPLSYFLWVEVHMSTTTGFTPSSATLKGTLASAAIFPLAGLTVGTTYYVKLLARNTSGVASAASAQASAVPTALTASLIGQAGVLNANPWFSGGDGTGWAGFNGTFSVSSSPPSGSPFAYAGLYTQVGATAGAAEESGQTFRVAPSTQYLVTAWIYTPTTSAIIGFDWQDGSHTYLSTSTQTFTVTANTWTLVTTVQTSNASAAWAYPRIAPAAGSGNTIYMEQVLVLPQVPGSLIQAGTITATQIAAATITAAQIAANTITASQIAANTITAAQIAANTITASQIASGTITAGLLAAGIVKSGIVDATTIQAAAYLATSTGGQFLAYGGTPASGNLDTTIAGASGTDSFSNSWPAGLYSQQLTLANQSSAPPSFSNSSVFYSSVRGRPRYLSQAGDDSVLDRSTINVATFSMTTQTTPTIIGAPISYLANEASQSSEFEIEIDGIIGLPTGGSGSGPSLTFQLFLDGSSWGASLTVGATSFPISGGNTNYTVRFRAAILTAGSSGTAILAAEGSFNRAATNAGNATIDNTPAGSNSGGTTKSIDTTVSHTIQPYANWSSTLNTGHNLATYLSRCTRRM